MRRVCACIRELWRYRVQWAGLEYGGVVPKESAWGTGEKGTVYVVNGFWGTARGMVPLARFLAGRGYRVHMLTGQRRTAGAEETAKLFAEVLEREAGEFSVVGFSMGGISALLALPKYAARVKRVVLVGTPLLGCAWGTVVGSIVPRYAPLSFFWRGRERMLCEAEGVMLRTSAVHGAFDEIVFPHGRVRGEAQRVPVCGHVSLMLAPRSWEAIVGILSA